MSQSDYGVLDPVQVSGTALAAALSSARDANHTQHSGNSRPSYAVEGMVWLNTTTDPIANYYTGSADIPIYQVDATTGSVRTVFSGDGTAYFKGGATGTVLGFVDGSEQFRMDATGVSIGGGAAAHALDVTGATGLTANAAGVVNGLLVQNSNGSGTAFRIASAKGLVFAADYENNSPVANSYIGFETDGQERLQIGAGGEIYLRNLPTSNPGEADRLFRTSTEVHVSLG